MKKKYSYLFVFTLIFFSFQPHVNAIYFKNGGEKVYYKENDLSFKFKKTKEYNHIAVIKKYGPSKDNTPYNAFCSDKDNNFYSGSSNSKQIKYEEDGKYESATCKYRLLDPTTNKWTIKNGGDCSRIVGYIIKESYEKGNNNFEDYAYAQAAIWGYLGSYASNEGNNNSEYLKNNNKSAHQVYEKNENIKSILRNAWTNYAKEYGTITPPSSKPVSADLISITPQNGKFYYKAASDQCGSNGAYYITDEITIKNNHTGKINLTIESTAGSEIGYTDSNGLETWKAGEYTPKLLPGSTIKIKIKSQNYIGNVNLKIKAITEENSHKDIKTEEYNDYDSQRWIVNKKESPNLDDNDPPQGLIVLTTTKRKRNVTYKTGLFEETNLTFNQDKITTKTPNKNKNNTEVTGNCANIAVSKDEISKILTGTTCKTISLGNNSFVRIILSETVKFEYGYLFPSKFTNLNEQKTTVYAGGSFNLNTNTTKGAITNYQASVTWDFADYNETNKTPYYYNGINPNQTNASDLISIINQKLLEGEKGIKKKYENLQLNIDTYDSNELENGSGKSIAWYKLNLYNNAKSITKNIFFPENSKTLATLSITQIELQKYKHKDGKNGIIEYGEGNNRGYFIPMYYPNGEFKFNINKTNLSIIDEIELNYTGICNIEVENRFNSKYLRYRTISLTNPFPKKVVPENWEAWYKENKNKTRLAETYKNPIIYSINLNKDKFKIINEYNQASFYTNWDNIITSDGTSKVIQREDLFEKKASTNSYCAIGVFSENCDIYTK